MGPCCGVEVGKHCTLIVRGVQAIYVIVGRARSVVFTNVSSKSIRKNIFTL